MSSSSSYNLRSRSSRQAPTPRPSSSRVRRPQPDSSSSPITQATEPVLPPSPPQQEHPHVTSIAIIDVPQHASREVAIERIETLLESILDDVVAGNVLFLPYQNRVGGRAQAADGDDPALDEVRATEGLRFPSRNPIESRQFGKPYRTPSCTSI
jgi:hypothetical protein